MLFLTARIISTHLNVQSRKEQLEESSRFQYCAEQLKEDRAFVLSAVKANGHTLKCLLFIAQNVSVKVPILKHIG